MTFLLCGCAQNTRPEVEPTRVTDVATTCGALKEVLHDAGTAWPVGSQPLPTGSTQKIITGFKQVAQDATGDVRTTLDAWVQGFETIAPFLERNDPDGAAQAVTEQQADINTLATANLNKFCFQ
ncbi:hypothetical protein [Mycetocola saprophilus]|uniref:hypothetical protein n=1 Tax=Mycetocola saprophilus TaxID=76636 RepID=UPI003BF1A61A